MSAGLATEVHAVQNVSVSQGDRAMLGCIVNNLGAKTVSRLLTFPEKVDESAFACISNNYPLFLGFFFNVSLLGIEHEIFSKLRSKEDDF